jgi:preprotein translocase subunit SecE
MWFGELFHIGVYKRSQGRITRQVTFATLAIAFALAAWRLYATAGVWIKGALLSIVPSVKEGVASGSVYGLSVALLMIGLWISFRVVNIPRFADFLIAVEAEINKVSWPSRPELVRSSIVVILVIFVLSTILFGFDLVWGWLFQWLGILKSAK